MANSLQIVFRSLGAVIILFVITRILGKKQISQLTMFEYILGITLGELVGFISTDVEAHYIHGLLALLVWFTVPFLFEHLTLRSRKLKMWMEGTATVIIEQGRVMEKNLYKERFSPDELMEELRKKDVFDINEVEYAVLETSGELNVLLKKQYQAVTPSMLNMEVANELAPNIVLMEGKIIREGLDRAGKSEDWTLTELKQKGCSLKDVFLGQIDDSGNLYVDLYDDKRVIEKLQKNIRTATDLTSLQADLQKCQANLELYGMSALSDEDRKNYSNCANDLQQVLHRLKPTSRTSKTDQQEENTS
ncbi:MAG: DUF421 domain-containing protein [Gorillibacterium sp.]|nr:DUF421 domain-containing protein [Gorillibacterium sp.]